MAKEPEGKVIGLRALGIGVIGKLGGMDADHLFAFAAAPATGGLFQRELDGTLARMRHTGDDGPIDLARRAVAQGFGQGAGHAVGARQHQDTGRVLVQPMHQLGLFLVAELQRFGQTIDMPVALARPALRGQARRLVQDDHVFVLEQHRRLDHPGIGGRDTLDPGFKSGGGVGQGGDPDHLPRQNPVRGLDPGTVDPNLAGAAQLFDGNLVQLRKAAAQPFVEALFAFILGHGQGLDGHWMPLASATPSATAIRERATVPRT